jgi:serine/threonine protein kinase
MAETSSGLIGGRYRVLGNLGKGAMGLVYMAYDPVLDRKVAIKQMTAEIADNEELRQRFHVEARAAARLNHPNIITIHELQEASGDIFMIMELLEGKSLAALVQAKPVPLSLEATLDVMGQVCDGLDYAHQKAIVHRDIKPANLFLTPSGTVKILDFGIARLGSLHMTAAGALIGTPDYMAPEQIRGDEIDRRTDLWAVGAVIYQLLSGTKPFEGRPLSKLLSSISQLPHVPLEVRAPAVPKSVSDLVDRLLSKPRDGRPATAGIVRDELRAILGRSSSAATKATLSHEDSDETLFVTTPSAPPPAPGTVRGVQAPAVSPLPPPLPPPPAARTVAPAVPPLSARTVAPTAPPLSARTAAPPSDAMLPPSGRTAATEAGEELPPAAVVVPPAPPRSQPPVAPSSQPAVAASSQPPVAPRPQQPAAPLAPTPKKSGSWLMIAVVAVAVVVLVGLTALGGAAWWYFTQRGAKGVEPPGEAGTTTSAPPSATPPVTTPPAQAEAEAPPPATPPAGEVPTQTGAPVAQAAASAQPPSLPTPATATSPPPPAMPATPPGAVPAAKPPATPPVAVRPPGAPVESGVVPSNAARPGVNQNTMDSLAGRQAGEGYDASNSASVQAAVSRINYVLEQYVRALVNADAEAIREFRPSLSPGESALMRARQLKVRLEEVRVEVNGAEATARCRRRISGTSESGAPLQEDGVAIYRLVRRASGWVIADVK